jgi:Na+/H+-dicarboxylate symporter/ABC-type amino acid transport substrate-binding protein
VSLSTQVLLGLFLGVATGVFFGEEIGFLAAPGRAFVVLLQMSVLPYVSVALVRNLGSLDPARARAIARSAGSFLLLVWALALAVVAAFPLAFPDWQAVSFFSNTLVEAPPRFDPVSLYLPANPFRAFADGVVPAVVVFSVALGLSVMASERKGALIESLATLEDSLQRLATFVVRLAPYGVFCISAHGAGTMRGDDLLGLQVYAAVYVVAALVLALWVLPGLVSSLTPFGRREVVADARAALVTAFATGSVFVVLPLLSQHVKTMLRSRQDARGAEDLVDVIVPIVFTLASAGKLLALGFVLFAGWLSGFPITLGELPRFLISGLFSFFASTTVAIPFLLDLFRVPADAFQLFLIADNVIGNRFGSFLASIHIMSVTLLGVCGAAHLLRVRRGALLRWAGVALLSLAIGFGGVRLGFESIDRPYEGYGRFVDRALLLPQAQVREPGPPDRPTGTTLDRIVARGAVRAGWFRDALPFVFRNAAGELVGFDVEMAHALARDLEVALELVEIERGSSASALASGAVDVVVGGVALTPTRLRTLGLSEPYLEATLCFIVPDHRRREFASRAALQEQTSLRLGMPRTSYYTGKLERYLPRAELVPLDSPRDFFQGLHRELDGLVYAAEPGSAWTLIYPEFSVAVPHPDVLKVPLGYAVRQGDPEMLAFVNHWILLKQRDGTIEKLFAYWFEGRVPKRDVEPRWSVLRDVLGWGRPGEVRAELR